MVQNAPFLYKFCVPCGVLVEYRVWRGVDMCCFHVTRECVEESCMVHDRGGRYEERSDTMGRKKGRKKKKGEGR